MVASWGPVTDTSQTLEEPSTKLELVNAKSGLYLWVGDGMVPSDYHYTCGDHFGCRDETKQHPTTIPIVALLLFKLGHIGGHATDIAFSLKFKQELQHL